MEVYENCVVIRHERKGTKKTKTKKTFFLAAKAAKAAFFVSQSRFLERSFAVVVLSPPFSPPPPPPCSSSTPFALKCILLDTHFCIYNGHSCVPTEFSSKKDSYKKRELLI